MDLNQAEIYIRTKQVFLHRYRNDQDIKAVVIHKEELSDAVLNQLIAKKRIVKVEDGQSSLYGCLYGGNTDFNLLPKRELPNDDLTKTIIENLQNVSIENSVSAWFNTFQKLKYKRIDLFVKYDMFSGRLHTPITTIKSDLRRSLLLYGKSTASIDVVQAQPTILAYLLLNEIGDNQFSNWILNNEDVYLIIQKKCKLSDRSEAKETFYKIIYGVPNGSLSKLFGHANWIDWVNQYKSVCIDGNPRSRDKPHTNLAWRLQSIEINLMKLVWLDLKRFKIPFLSVHDEILVREFEVLKAFEIMRSRLQESLSSVQLSIKHSSYFEDIRNVLQNIKDMNLIDDNLLDRVYNSPLEHEYELRYIYSKMDRFGYKEFQAKY